MAFQDELFRPEGENQAWKIVKKEEHFVLLLEDDILEAENRI